MFVGRLRADLRGSGGPGDGYLGKCGDGVSVMFRKHVRAHSLFGKWVQKQIFHGSA
jgi:hypothetical protein